MSEWQVSWRADPVARVLADRHYNRQRVGAKQFVPPGACDVLRTPDGAAFWVTSRPYAEYVKHEWAGAWMCSAFRREGGPLASALIREACAVTRHLAGDPPPLGMVTFIDPRHVAGYFRRTPIGRVLEWGYSYHKAGFQHVGWTKGNLYAMQLLPADFPEAAEPLGTQLELIA